jgi:diazepam-binding inhibitor (GABA receptor modulator, acyl-CoA-binding protein)
MDGLMDRKEQFEDAQARVKKLAKRPSNDALLELYGLYKQATEGDVQGKRPGMLDIKGKAKFDAWTSRKGMSRDAAMDAYGKVVDRLVAADGK